jgi:hypothetical protein
MPPPAPAISQALNSTEDDTRSDPPLGQNSNLVADFSDPVYRMTKKAGPELATCFLVALQASPRCLLLLSLCSRRGGSGNNPAAHIAAAF